jgi:Domain of unknown function (DUF1707)/Domain of unknown function (DUF4190)
MASDPRYTVPSNPSKPRPLPGYSYLRASAADREQVIGTLKTGFLEGRLTKDEYDERVGRALTARTYGDLGRLTEDLPGPPPGHPFPHWSPPALPAERQPNRLAVAALVLALIPGLTSPIGLILGLAARNQIRSRGGRGAGMANAAIVIGAIFTVILVLRLRTF